MISSNTLETNIVLAIVTSPFATRRAEFVFGTLTAGHCVVTRCAKHVESSMTIMACGRHRAVTFVANFILLHSSCSFRASRTGSWSDMHAFLAHAIQELLDLFHKQGARAVPEFMVLFVNILLGVIQRGK
jgi:hypothetical protein